MIFTSEQVSCGHPDKICDQISDAIVTYCLKQDKNSRCAIETMIKDNDIFIVGELTTESDVMKHIIELAKETMERIGLYDDYFVHTLISKQSPDIAMGVDIGGAGDQGLMFGYATNETPEMLPIPYAVATYALILMDNERNEMLGRDAKSQVSFDYETGKITTFLISSQHKEEYTVEDIKPYIEDVMKRSARAYGLNEDFKILINPTGRFVIGSSHGDSGVTGRKIIADTYGGVAHHGGGAFSGKDASKVDRSAAYMARKVAKDIVRKGMCDKCEIQVAYAIGVKEPVSLNVNAFGTNHCNMQEIENYVNNIDWTPQNIIKTLDLKNVDYNLTSAYGHFGKPYLPWEQ
jgi:S-adenosylmethionine synthetase